MAFYQLHREQIIPSTIDKVWEFISSPANLKIITPDYMGFDIITPDLNKKMYPGMIISYKVSPLLGIKMTWVTEITHIVEKEYFIDEQRIGPYAIWHHEHKIELCDQGVMMSDIVSYKPPFWFLGVIANRIFIRRQLNEIFDYRKSALEKIFGKYKITQP